MYLLSRRPLCVTLLLLSIPCVRAQSPADASGHWEGVIKAPKENVIFEVDLVKSKGEFAGTISIPAQNVKGIPLLKVSVEGRSITFYARADQPFSGEVSEDGKSISGELTGPVLPIEINLTRTGEARVEAPARNTAIGKELEGTWNGALDVNGTQARLVLTLSNQPDGTAVGRIVSLDEGKMVIPVSTITQAESRVNFGVRAVGGSWAGVLDGEGTELAGTYRQGALVAPLTFRHVTGDDKR